MTYTFTLDFTQDTTEYTFDSLWTSDSTGATIQPIVTNGERYTPFESFDPNVSTTATTYYFAKYVSKPVTVVLKPFSYSAEPEDYTVVINGQTVKSTGGKDVQASFRFTGTLETLALKIDAINGPAAYNGTYKLMYNGLKYNVGQSITARRGSTVTFSLVLEESTPSVPTKETVVINVASNYGVKGKINVESSVGSKSYNADFEFDNGTTVATTKSYKAEFEYE